MGTLVEEKKAVSCKAIRGPAVRQREGTNTFWETAAPRGKASPPPPPLPTPHHTGHFNPRGEKYICCFVHPPRRAYVIKRLTLGNFCIDEFVKCCRKAKEHNKSDGREP